MGTMIQFPAPGGAGPAWLSLPPEGVGPGLIVIQEIWGLVDHITQVVDRFAGAGFVTLAPDLYDGAEPATADDARRHFMALDIQRAAAVIRAAGQYLVGLPACTSSRVGAVGFCMGGQLALYAGLEYPDTIGAVVDFYGVHPDVPIDPSRLRVPVLAHFATRDKAVPPAAAEALVDKLQASGQPVEAHYYEAQHGFFNDSRPERYSAPNAALAWERTVDFLKATLATPPS